MFLADDGCTVTAVLFGAPSEVKIGETEFASFSMTAQDSNGDFCQPAWNSLSVSTHSDNGHVSLFWNAGTTLVDVTGVSAGVSKIYVKVNGISSNLQTVDVVGEEEVQPLSVGPIEGPTWIDQPGTYSWRATASGGNGSFTFKWQKRVSGGSWTTLQTNTTSGSSTEWERIACGTAFELQVVVTSGDQQQTAGPIYVDATSIICSWIDGPSAISRYQSAQYTAVASGGHGGYTYKWRTRDYMQYAGSWSSWSSWYSTGAQNYTYASVNSCGISGKELEVMVADADGHTDTSLKRIDITNPC